MTKVAVVIGVATYDSAPDLPACESDAGAIADFLKSTGQYSRIVPIAGRVEREAVAEAFQDLVEAYRDSDVSEVFFYFSGHGAQLDEEPRLLLSNASSDRLRLTSIGNTEVDDWLRPIGPNVYFKLVDSCYSGERYIKAIGATPDLGENRLRRQFREVYFGFSSQADQTTPAGIHLSPFTEYFLQNISRWPDQAVTYQDLIDGALDLYPEDPNSTPLKVIQGPPRSIYLDKIPPASREVLRTLMPVLSSGQLHSSTRSPSVAPGPTGTPNDSGPKDHVENLSGLVQQLEARTLSTAVVEGFERSLLAALGKTEPVFDPSELDLSEIYELIWHTIDKSDYSSARELPDTEQIGKWLSYRKGTYFAHPTWSNPRRQSPLEEAMYGEAKPRIDGYYPTAGMKFDAVELQLKPRSPALREFRAFGVFLWSRFELTIFSCQTFMKPTSLDSSVFADGVAWSRRQFEVDEILDGSLATKYVRALNTQLVARGVQHIRDVFPGSLRSP